MATGQSPAVAYFSMEICLEESLPTYSGGLGVLAGDTLRSAADLRAPMAAVTLAHRKGYFRQHLDANGVQSETSSDWSPENRLPAVAATVTIEPAHGPVSVTNNRAMNPAPATTGAPTTGTPMSSSIPFPPVARAPSRTVSRR